MIPVIENWVKSCQTGDVLSEVGFLAGIIAAGAGIYRLYTDVTQNKAPYDGLITTAAGSTLMIGSLVSSRITSRECQYRYQDEY